MRRVSPACGKMSQTNLLIIGVGSIGERHVRCFGRTGRVRISICDSNAALCEQVATRYDVARWTSSLDEALVESCDAAVICTPAHLHIPMAAQLTEAGIDLLIEKPLSTSLEGVAELTEAIA